MFLRVNKTLGVVGGITGAICGVRMEMIGLKDPREDKTNKKVGKVALGVVLGGSLGVVAGYTSLYWGPALGLMYLKNKVFPPRT